MRNRSDLFTRLNNGNLSRKKTISAPFSFFSLRFLQILQREGYIKNWFFHFESQPSLSINLKRESSQNTSYRSSAPLRISQISKKGRPVYVSAKDLWQMNRGVSLYVLSTNRGLLTDREARRYSVGGELLCKID